MRISWLLFFTVMTFLLVAAAAIDLRNPPYSLVATYPNTGDTNEKVGKRLAGILASQDITLVAIDSASSVSILVPAGRSEDTRRLLAESFEAGALTLKHLIRSNRRAQAVGSTHDESLERRITGLPVVSTRNDRANAATIARIDELFKEHNLGMRGFASAAVVWHTPVPDWARARKIISKAIEAEGLPAKLIVPSLDP